MHLHILSPMNRAAFSFSTPWLESEHFKFLDTSTDNVWYNPHMQIDIPTNTPSSTSSNINTNKPVLTTPPRILMQSAESPLPITYCLPL